MAIFDSCQLICTAAQLIWPHHWIDLEKLPQFDLLYVKFHGVYLNLQQFYLYVSWFVQLHSWFDLIGLRYHNNPLGSNQNTSLHLQTGWKHQIKVEFPNQTIPNQTKINCKLKIEQKMKFQATFTFDIAPNFIDIWSFSWSFWGKNHFLALLGAKIKKVPFFENIIWILTIFLTFFVFWRKKSEGTRFEIIHPRGFAFKCSLFFFF